MKVVEEFHAMPAKDKARECSKDPNKISCRLYTSSENFSTEELHYWRDALVHPCHPLDEHMQFWPQNPIQYRYVRIFEQLLIFSSIKVSFHIFKLLFIPFYYNVFSRKNLTLNLFERTSWFESMNQITYNLIS